jgi:hypothetical protein
MAWADHGLSCHGDETGREREPVNKPAAWESSSSFHAERVLHLLPTDASCLLCFTLDPRCLMLHLTCSSAGPAAPLASLAYVCVYGHAVNECDKNDTRPSHQFFVDITEVLVRYRSGIVLVRPSVGWPSRLLSSMFLFSDCLPSFGRPF